MNFAPVDPTIDRTTPDKFGQTVNEGMNYTLGQLVDTLATAKLVGGVLVPENFTEKEWRVIQALQS
jgi:hypothetical protein